MLDAGCRVLDEKLYILRSIDRFELYDTPQC